MHGNRENHPDLPHLACLRTNIHPKSPFSDCPVLLVNTVWYPLTQLHMSGVGCTMNNSPSCDLYPCEREREGGGIDIQISIYL